jgi:hypothetical protein
VVALRPADIDLAGGKVRVRGRRDRVPHRLLLQPRSKGVMCQLLDMFAQAGCVAHLDHLNYPRMKRTPTILEEPPIGDFMRECVLERVFEVWEEARFVEELRSLEMTEPMTERLLTLVCDRLQRAE